MSDALLRRCAGCSRYSLRPTCPACGGRTVSPHPARYSPEDRYGRYRRALYEAVAREAASGERPTAGG